MTTSTYTAVPTTTVPILPKVRKERLYTLQEYLRKEEKSEKKHFFLNGKIVEMPGSSPNHSFINARVLHLILSELEKKGLDDAYKVGTSDLKIWIPSKNSVLYPDAVVVCLPVEYADDSNMVVINPLVIIEILSPSTRSYDAAGKFFLYKTIPSFKEYILIETDRPFINVFHKQATGKWEGSEIEGLENMLDIHSIGIDIPLKKIYKDVKFENGDV